MNTFKRKALFTAVVAGLGVAGSAEAVFIAPNGTGQALLFPYYTVQNSGTNSWNTYISVVNTTDLAKAVKVRILEGRTSAEVLDFNLFLSANDVWTAAIVPVDATNDSGGKLITADRSCTAPAIDITGSTSTFRNYQYSAQAAGLGRGLDRTREGYIEMIEMATFAPGTDTYIAVTHDGSGVPDDCSFVQVANQALINADADPQTGGLTGTGTLINVNLGQDVGYKPDALDAFSELGVVTGPGLTTPSLEEVDPPSSVIFNTGFDPVTGTAPVTVYRNDWLGGSHVSAGAQALASVFQHQSIINEYVLDTAVAGLTDWVVTQPIKSAFVDAVTASPPYTNKLTASGACETIEFQYFNREERGATASGIDFSPPPPAGNPSSICWESTVISIRNGAAHMPAPSSTVSGVLGSRNSTSIQVTPTFQNGWARMTFTGASAVGVGLVNDVTSDGAVFDTNLPTAPFGPAAASFFGLPVTGFMIRTFGNSTLTCGTASCQGSYSALFNHAYVNLIAP
ncbi:MAG: hypothetical protein ABIQ72_15205 [Usitatibacter sp.]